MDEGTHAFSANIQPIQERLDIGDLHTAPMDGLCKIARESNLRHTPDRSRHQLVFDILKFKSAKGVPVFADGILEMSAENHGFLRWPLFNFKPGPDDVYVSPQFIKSNSLKNGNRVTARLRTPRDREKFMTVEEITAVEGVPASEWVEPKAFEE